MKLRNTSASQVDTYTNCPRLWFFGWVMGLRAPPTAAQQRGTYIHDGAEYAQKNDGKLKGNEWDPYVQSMLEHMPIGKPKVLVEREIWIDTAPGLPKWKGFIDLLDDSRTFSKWLRITDYKTTSDFRYAKTPNELLSNSQMISYARWVFDQVGTDDEYVEVGHLYVKAAKKTPKKPKVKPVFVDVDRLHVESVWEQDLVKVEEMVRIAETTENPDQVYAKGTTNGHCKKYGGCPHRSRCGIQAEANPFGNKNGKGKSIMSTSFLEKLAAKKAAGTTNGVKVPTGVLPEDAPERTTPVKAKNEPEEGEETKAEAPKTTVKKKTTRKKAAKKAAPAGDGFTLYIDCTPIKMGDLPPTLFEDWLSSITFALNQEVLEEKNLPDYRLLPYAEEKALFSMRVNEALGNMPQEMVVSSGTPGAKDALAVLVPHATQVIRGLRG